jgi:DUF4097 and DUF4098 domain-containing protein YvlB
MFILKNKSKKEHNMKTIKLISTVTLAILLSAKSWAQDSGKEQLVVPLSDPGKPYKLGVSLVDGSITVTGYEGKDIIIDVYSGDKRKNGEEHSSGMRRLSNSNNAEVEAQEHDNQVNIYGTAGKTVSLVIKIPMNDVNLKLNTVNNGNITGSNISGNLEVTNVNGAIKLSNVAGSVVANTVNGSVVVIFRSIDPKAAMAFSTLNGNVDVTFPASLKASVKLKSDRGDIYTDFDVVTDPHKPEVIRADAKGMYSIKIEDWVYGKINGGGPQFLMKNMNGSIYIRKAK